ncbi:MAG: WD40 repeat domain-containing protein, partial [Lentisphaeria bacterium]|nr:WD40 repeat domain-containing protein [Lentisphaeria bacterium]
KKSSGRKKMVFEDRQEGSLKVRFSVNAEPEEKNLRVREDCSNVQILAKTETASGREEKRISDRERRVLASLRTVRDGNSLAAKISAQHPEKRILWSPAMWEDPSGRSRIENCVISPDSSVILFTETIGDQKGPYGSRLIFMDTHSWKILAVHSLAEYYIKEISFFPDGSCLFSCAGQTSLRSRDLVVHFDPVHCRVLHEYPVPGLRKAWAAPDGRFALTYRKDSPDCKQIRMYVPAGKSGKTDPVSLTVEGENISPVLAFSADGSFFYACGDRTLETYAVKNLRQRGKVSLPENYECVSLMMLENGGSVIVSPDESLRQKALRIREGVCHPFGEIAAGYLFPVSGVQGKVFGSLLSKKGKVAYYSFSSLEETKEIIPEECRVRTVGKPWKVFTVKHRPDLLAVLDLSGNFYLLFRGKNEKKYRKEILVSSSRWSKK